jgi:beta-lactamase regulating signal transducer with metallopeptidase domain
MTDLLFDTWAAVMWKACWQGSLVVLAVWLICLLIPSMPARCRCWLWRLAVLKFMVVLLPTLVNLPLLPARSVASPMPDVAVQVVRQQVPARPIEPVEFCPSREISLPSIPAILAFFWIIGVGWSLARLLVAWQGARQLRRQSRMIDNTPLIEELVIQARLYGLRASPRLLENEGDGSPMLIGILRPAIVIPDETLRRLSFPELAMVLGHELAHIRRGDLLWNLAAAGVRALFFFHPLVWLSERQLNLAQEVAADELAILRQHGDPVSYGKLLVSVVSKLGPSRLIPTMSMGTAGSVQSLTRRLVAMANTGRASRGIILTSGIILATTFLLGIVPWRLVAAEPKQGIEEQGFVNPKAIPPKAPVTHYARRGQRLANIEVWERKIGQRKIVLYCPQILFGPGHEATTEVVAVGDKPWLGIVGDKACIEIEVRSLADTKPIQHVVAAKLILDPKAKSSVRLMAPKLTLTDDKTGSVVVTKHDGSELGIDVTVYTENEYQRHWSLSIATSGVR